MSERIRVLIADGQPIVCHGLIALLAEQPDMELVAEATSGEQIMYLAQETQPAVIIMDLKMPVKDGLIVIEEIVRAGLLTAILVLTSFPDDDSILAAIKAGAKGLLLKDSSLEYLLAAIRAVHRGESILHPIVARRLIEEMQRNDEQPLVKEVLTAREVEVLGYLSQGMANREIACALSLSIRTVTTHVRNILDKLHLSNRTQAALYARERGITPAHEQ